MDNVIVDLSSNFPGEMGRSVGHALARKCGSVLRKQKLHDRYAGEQQNGTFHLLSLLFIFRQHSRGSYSSLLREKLRVVSRFTFVNVRCR